MAQTLKELGSERAWLVHGCDGSDEITITGGTAVVVLDHGEITTQAVHPEDAGLPTHPLSAILGGSPEANGAALRRLLEGEHSAYRDAVLLNAAAALVVVGQTTNLKDGCEMARESIDAGHALGAVTSLARITASAGR